MSYVLVVEDDEALAELFKFYIESQGFKVKLASSIDEIKQCISQGGTPSLTILDYILKSNFNGLSEIISFLKHTPHQIVLTTAAAHPEKLLPMFNLEWLLKKPFSLEELDFFLKNI